MKKNKENTTKDFTFDFWEWWNSLDDAEKNAYIINSQEYELEEN